VRREALADLAAIRAIHEASFPTPAEGQLVDALRAFQALELRPGAIPHGIGLIRYPPEFAALDAT
jgi:predicted N-acetyltransferase YhbS